jgi:hypothetical protein
LLSDDTIVDLNGDAMAIKPPFAAATTDAVDKQDGDFAACRP